MQQVRADDFKRLIRTHPPQPCHPCSSCLVAFINFALLFCCLLAPVTNAQPALPPLKVDSFEPNIREQLRKAHAVARAQPREPAANGKLGMLLHTYELYDDALVCYAKARRLAPTDVRWHYYAGLAHAALGQFAEAVPLLEQSVRLRPGDLAIQLQLAETLLSQGELAASQQRLAEITKRHGALAQVHYALGRIAAAQGHHDESIAQFEQAIALYPEYGAAHFALGNALRKLGATNGASGDAKDKAQTALALSQQYQQRRPPLDDPLQNDIAELNQSAITLLKRGILFETVGKLEPAAADHETALARNPKLVQAHINLISLYARLGQNAKAEQHFQAALRLNPNLPDSYYNYGVLLTGLERRAEAMRAFRQCLERDAAHPGANFNYGVLIEQQGQLDEAAAHYRRTLERQPTHRRAHFHLGRILANQNRAAAAIEHFLQTLAPEDEETAQYAYALGATYANSGQREPALKYLQYARKLAQAKQQTALVQSIERALQQIAPSN